MSTPVKRGVFRRTCRTCGWSGEYSTAAQGTYAKKRHDCAKWLRKAESAERHAGRMAAVDRAPKPCHHKEADHQHGTYACYILDRCRCAPCCEAQHAWYDENNRQKAYGRWDNLVSADRARAHILHLMDQGMGLKRIVVVSDISQGLLWKLIYGKRKPDGSRTPSKRIRKDTEARILAIELDLAGGAVVDGTETITRLRSLVALGWSMSKICTRLGIGTGNFGPIIHGRRRLTTATVKAADALFEELSMTLPPHESHRDKIAYSRALNYAASQGWVAPLDLEDLADHDDRSLLELVAAGPDIDEAAVWRAVNGDRDVQLTAADRQEVITVLHRRGLTDRQVRELTGFKDPGTMRKRLGLPTNHDGINWSEYGEGPRTRNREAS